MLANVLNVGEGDGHFLHDHDAFAHAQAAVSDDIPALLEIEPDEREGEETKRNQERESQTRNEEQQKAGFVPMPRGFDRSHDGTNHHQGNDDEREQALQDPEEQQVFVIGRRGAEQARAGFVAGRWLGVARNAQQSLGELAEGIIHGGKGSKLQNQNTK
jgi:hypothetical protein